MGGRSKIDVTGQRFTKLLVLRFKEGQTDKRHQKYVCLCDCGNEVLISSTDLRLRGRQSCGCWGKEKTRARMTTHGLSEAKEYYMWSNAKHRAKVEGVPFTIEPQDVVIPEFCPVLGIKLKIDNEVAEANSPSIDKLVPALGYTKGNVCVISYKANTIKSNATLEELQKVTQWVESRLNR